MSETDTTLVLTSYAGFRVGDREMAQGDEISVAALYEQCRDRNTIEMLVRTGTFTPKGLLESKAVEWNGTVEPLSGYRLDEWVTQVVIHEGPDKDASGDHLGAPPAPPKAKASPPPVGEGVTLVADDDLDSLGEVPDPGPMSVAQVKAHVEVHPSHAPVMADAERSGRARASLLDWLEAR